MFKYQGPDKREKKGWEWVEGEQWVQRAGSWQRGISEQRDKGQRKEGVKCPRVNKGK